MSDKHGKYFACYVLVICRFISINLVTACIEYKRFVKTCQLKSDEFHYCTIILFYNEELPVQIS